MSDWVQAKVDSDKEKVSFARPDLEHLRRFCREKFGWDFPKTDDLLTPVLKVGLLPLFCSSVPQGIFPKGFSGISSNQRSAGLQSPFVTQYKGSQSRQQSSLRLKRTSFQRNKTIQEE